MLVEKNLFAAYHLLRFFYICSIIYEKEYEKKQPLIDAVLRFNRSKYSIVTLIAAVLLGTAANNPYSITLIAAVNEGPAANTFKAVNNCISSINCCGLSF